MAISDPNTIEIREVTMDDGLKSYVLYIDNCERGVVVQRRDGKPRMYFDPVGAFDWPEAKVWLQGLLELSVIADQLQMEATHGKRKTK